MSKIVKEDELTWYKNPALWAGVAGVAGFIAGAFGLDGSAFTEAFTELGRGIAAAIGGLVSLIAVVGAGKGRE